MAHFAKHDRSVSPAVAANVDLFVVECYGYAGRLAGHVTWEVLKPRLPDLRARRFCPAFRALMQFQVERARSLFHQGQPLVALMPAEVQADIELFIRGGQGILDKIEAIDYNVWRRRPALSRWDKAALVGGVLWRRIISRIFD